MTINDFKELCSFSQSELVCLKNPCWVGLGSNVYLYLFIGEATLGLIFFVIEVVCVLQHLLFVILCVVVLLLILLLSILCVVVLLLILCVVVLLLILLAAIFEHLLILLVVILLLHGPRR